MSKRLSAVLLIGVLALMLTVAVCPGAWADTVAEGTCGTSVTWTLDSNGKLTISGTGAMTGKKDYLSYSDSIRTVVIGEGVTSINWMAFSGCTFLKSITIPSSVTSISTAVFQDCESLTSVTIPNGVTSISDGTFGFCKRLKSITIPGSVTSIGEEAFYACYCLADVYYDGTEAEREQIEIDANNDELANATWHCTDTDERTDETIASGTCGDSVTWTLDSAYTLTISGSGAMADYDHDDLDAVPWSAYRAKVRSIVIGDGVTSIGNCAFKECTRATSVTIADSVTIIENEAFAFCYSLTEITIPENVKQLHGGAFGGSGLMSVTIPKSVTKIDQAFEGCADLASITVAEGNTVYRSEGNCLLEGNEVIQGCYTSVIPMSATSIGWNAFMECIKLTSITIPAGVTSISDQAFCDCSGLKSVKILGDVTSIEERTFQSCTSLTSITVPASLTSIGECAFNGCDSLTDVYYGGSELDKAEIDIDEENDPLTAATWHYGEIPSEIASGTCGTSATWTLDGAYTLTISGTGAMTDYESSDDQPWYGYRDKIKAVVVEDGITRIGKNSLCELKNAESITIPSGVTTIPSSAFFDDSALTSITISASVTQIGDWAFDCCDALTDVYYGGKIADLLKLDISDSVGDMGESNDCLTAALWHCTDGGYVPESGSYLDGSSFLLYQVDDDGSATIGGYRGEETALTIPSSLGGHTVTKIGRQALRFTDIVTVSIPSTVTEIGEEAFCECCDLTTVWFSSSVKTIGDCAFGGTSESLEVWFDGLEEERASIDIGEDNEPLTEGNWHYAQPT